MAWCRWQGSARVSVVVVVVRSKALVTHNVEGAAAVMHWLH